MVRSVLVCTIFFVLVISFSVGNSAVFQGEPNIGSVVETDNQMVPANSYTPHGPITISSNTDFSLQGWPGSGISGNPYVIEGLNITADAVCISITDTTVYFEVKDCVVSSGYGSSHEGIFLFNVTHGKIQNCIISKHEVGITLRDSSSCTLTLNTVSNTSDYGFYVQASYSITLIDNTATSSEASDGFCISESNSCILTTNIANNNSWFGFQLHASDRISLIDNTAVSNNDGFHLDNSSNCTLTNNTASSNTEIGFFLHTSDSVSLMNNTASTNSDGFQLTSSDNCTLLQNTAANNNDGFCLDISSNCTLTHNIVINNTDYGINLGFHCKYNTLYLNRIGDNGWPNAQDNGESNAWDDGISSGNYWKDYNGIGSYSLPGQAESVDNYPFVWDQVSESIDTMLIVVLSGVGLTIVVIVIVIFVRKNNT